MLRRPALLIMSILLLVPTAGSLGQSQESPRQDRKSADQQTGTGDASAPQPSAVIKGPDAKQTEKEAAANPAKAQYDRRDGWNLSDKIAVIASLVGFLQFIALIATYYVMRGTARRQLRAYITDVSGTATFISDAESRIEIEVRFRNAGQTPAYNVNIRCANPTIERPHDRPFDKPSPFAPIKTIISPGRKFSLRRMITQVSAEQVRQIQNGERAIWVWGRVDYVDAFNEARYLDFQCFALGFGKSWKLMPAPEGYRAN